MRWLRTMVVTGGAKGIGREICLQAGGEGYRVVVADLDEGGGRATAEDVRGRGGAAAWTYVDMADPASVRALVDGVVAAHGRLDVLVNNAAVTRGLGFFEVGVDDWNLFFDTNARGCFFAMQRAAEVMADRGGGAIVNIASIAGKGWSGTSNIAYASTKGAVLAMTRVAASQLGHLGVRVNAVCPGVTDTALLDQVVRERAEQGGAPVEEQRAALASLSSLRRLTAPRDIAGAVLYLASDAAQGVTGQSLNVDSGIIWD
ncbi:SDR family oxidoreductase [Nocardioides carbamazepini]|uniref:SDR family NAD(P)-dependent oxidoreductase n=1 Tax=Nocardioides carbamazepini TaxID=2854259 RepID=UPI002149D3FD|nr:SDR family NAD(P)-dependent oxidoreductase [Nocardioides carbamazepini]MCR1783781.1 SDR family oxidoreductase [Nocardioides carbamazepini]